MYKLYKKDEVWFSVLWIIIYCLISIPIRGELGDESIFMLLSLFVIALGITLFIKKYNLEDKYGLKGFMKEPKKYWYFIPLIILATGNIWGGIDLKYEGISLIFSILSMFLIGYIEEVIFRGFLFKGMLKTDSVKKSIIISAVTFGIGHIVNLLAGQANLETIMQVFFAIAWGFIFTAVFFKSKSLIPCIITHGVVNSLSMLGKESILMGWVYIFATIIIAIIYCTYLFKLKEDN